MNKNRKKGRKAMGRKGARDRCIQEFVKRGEGLSPQSSPPSSLYVSKKGCGGENKKNGRKFGRGGGEGRF